MHQADKKVELTSADRTLKLGEHIAKALKEGGIICLEGPLGAGKTTLVKGVGSGLGVTEVINSPTFMMLNEYHTGALPLFHFDLYRITEDPDSAESKRSVSYLQEQLDELLVQKCFVLIEWPGPLQAHLPEDYILIRLDYDQEEGRVAVISGSSSEFQSQITKIIDRVIST